MSNLFLLDALSASSCAGYFLTVSKSVLQHCINVMFLQTNRFYFWPLVLLLLSRQHLWAAPKPPGGPRIYVQQCARCHGPKGQGVQGKYDDALQGDWPLEKL